MGFSKAIRLAEKDKVKTVAKAIQLCEGLSRHKGPVSLKDLIEESGLHKTTTHRLLQTLHELNLVVQDPRTKKYRLGPRFISLGLSALRNFDLHQEALPLMKALRDETGETVNLSILDGNEIMVIERFRSNSLFSMNLSVGSRLPIYCTSQGLAILAFLNPKRREAILKTLRLKPLTPNTILDKERLRARLAEIRQNGYAINYEEFEVGIRAVAGPILNHAGEAVASMNVSFATVRHPEPAFLDSLAQRVVQACQTLSFSLGYLPSAAQPESDSSSRRK
jgi:IclR family KDG regulon transcriptional repressor